MGNVRAGNNLCNKRGGLAWTIKYPLGSAWIAVPGSLCLHFEAIMFSKLKKKTIEEKDQASTTAKKARVCGGAPRDPRYPCVLRIN